MTPIYTENPNIPFNTYLTEAFDTERHAHEFIEVFYILNGKISHNVNGLVEDLQVGDLYLIFPNTPHHFIRHGACAHRDFVINLSLAKSAFAYINQEFFDNLQRNKCMRCKISTNDILFFETNLKNYFEESDISKRKNFEKVLTSSLLGLVYLHTNQSAKIDHFRLRCEEAISNSFIQKNALELIRSELGYNKYYLCKKFKETFGVTLLTYVNKLKLNHACYLLKTTRYTLTEICEQVGFDSMPYFIKIFTAQYGVTPAKYRKNNP